MAKSDPSRRALEDVGRERAGLDAQLPPVIQAAGHLVEPVAQGRHDRLLLSVGVLLDAKPSASPSSVRPPSPTRPRL